MCPLLKKIGSLDHMCMNLLFCNKLFHCMHTDCIQKFRFSSNENVALPGQHHLGISKKKKGRRSMILLSLLFWLSLRALNSLDAAKCKKKDLNSETTHSLPTSLACSQYLSTQKTTTGIPTMGVHCPVSREWCLPESALNMPATRWMMLCKAEKSNLV